MKWRGRRESGNVEDRRFSGGGRRGRGPGKISLIGIVLILTINYFTGGSLLDGISNVINSTTGTTISESNYVETAESKDLASFTKVVLSDTEDVWSDIFKDLGGRYNAPTLVMFNGSTNSGCGYATSQTGPFYCPNDRKVYIDLDFYKELKNRFGAPGDFAMAYVIAHEVGHHVQNELGVTKQFFEHRAKLSKKEANRFTVKLELQADYLAGVFAKRIQNKGYLEEGDIEEAINAASSIGDDTIQKRSSGRVVPDSFTHGTSEQRVRWFMKGYKAGDLSEWDTFNSKDL